MFDFIKRQLIIALLLCVPAFAFAATDEEGYNEYTIRPSDIPHDAPKFENFPVKPFHGKNAVPNLLNDATTKMHRSRLALWAKEKPNFAGHYILATWGCGTDCTQIAIIDARTGKIYHPRGATSNFAVNVHDALLEGGGLWYGEGAIKFRQDSRLLIIFGSPEERDEDRGISYFLWKNNQLKRIRFVYKPYGALVAR